MFQPGDRRPFDQGAYSDFSIDSDVKKRRTGDTIWDTAPYGADPLPPPPPFPYADSMDNVGQMLSSADDPWKMMRQFDNVGSAPVSASSSAFSTSGGANWGGSRNGSGGGGGFGKGSVGGGGTSFSGSKWDGGSSWGGSSGSNFGGSGGSNWQGKGGGGAGGGGGGSKWGGSGGRGGSNQMKGRGRGKQFSFGSRKSDTDFTDDLALLKAAEIQYKTKGSVDFEKIKRALQIVNEQSEFESQGIGNMGHGGRGRGMWNQSYQEYSGGQSFGNNQRGGRVSRNLGQPRTTPYDKAVGFGGGGFQKQFGNNNMGRGGPRGGGRGTGRGRGGRGGQGSFGQVAPVHSLAKVTSVDPSSMSVAEKIRRFSLFVQNDTMKVNDIQTIENAITGSKLGMTSDYQVEELIRVNNKMMYSGRLYICGVFMARTAGANKKELKHECYSKALEVLKTKSVTTIMKLQDVGIETMRAELTASLKDGTSANPMLDVQKKIATLEDGANTAVESELGDGFQKLIQYLKSEKATVPSKISELTQAFQASKSGLTHKYNEEESRLSNNRFWFHGKLLVNDILISSASSNKKKDAKLKAFEKAIVFLKTKPLHVILNGVTVEEADSMPTVMNVEDGGKTTGRPPADNSARPNDKTQERLAQIINSVQEESSLPEGNSIVNSVDVLAHQIQLVPTCVYRKMDILQQEGQKPVIQCDLYLDNIYIATGEADKRKMAQTDAYTKAVEILQISAADAIYSDFKRLQPEDTKGPDILEVWVKGQSRSGDSNLQRLKRMRLDQEGEGKEVADIILMEHHDWAFDRKRHAFSILNLSATQNGMLMEWNVEASGTFFKCTLMIQQEKVGEASAPSKNAARNLACADALFKLYESQNTLKIISRDESNFWIVWDTVKEKADKLKQESGDTGSEDDDMMFVDLTINNEPETDNQADDCKKEDPEDADSKPVAINKWIKSALEQMIEKYSFEETMDELIFGTGFSLGERKVMSQIASDYELRYSFKQAKENSYSTIFRKYMPEKIYEIVKKYGGHSGKYCIIPKTLLPKHADIEDSLKGVTESGRQGRHFKKDQSMDTSSEYQTADSTFFSSTPGQKSFGSAKGFKGKSPFSDAGPNASFQTSTPRSGKRGKRGRGGMGRGGGMASPGVTNTTF